MCVALVGVNPPGSERLADILALPILIHEIPTEFLSSENFLRDQIKVRRRHVAGNRRALWDEPIDDLTPHGDRHILAFLNPAHNGGEVLSNISDACSFHCFTEMFNGVKSCQERPSWNGGGILRIFPVGCGGSDKW